MNSEDSSANTGRSMPSLNIEIPQTKANVPTSQQKPTSPEVVTSHLRRSLEAPSPNRIPTPQPSPKLLRLISSSSLPSPPKCSSLEISPSNEPKSASPVDNRSDETATMEPRSRPPSASMEPRSRPPSVE